MRKTALLLVVLWLSVAAAGGEAVKFTTKPTARKAGDKTVISFAVSGPTDVAVYVLDAKGQVVRHLVAGVVGAKGTPPAPLKAGLSQQVDWDGKDDAGKPAAGGPFKVRVRAGTKPEFDRFLLFEPDAFPGASSVAPDGKGNLYVFYRDPTANGNQGGHKIRIIDREGRFVRQILPFPADAPYEKVKAAGTFRDEEGRLVPNCHNWHRLEFYPNTIAARGRSMSDFSQPVVDGKGTLYWVVGGGRLCAVNADGTLPYDDFLGPKLFPGLKSPGGSPALCLSGDGKSLYLAGIWNGRWGKGKHIPCVYRVEIATRKAEVFVGDPAAPGKEKSLFSRPRGVACAKGLLYVADPAAGRVAVFKEADKSFVGEIKCVLPHIVQVNPETEEVYVVSYVPEAKPRGDGKCRIKNANLLKFKSWKESTPTAKMALPKTGLSPNGGTHRIALDAGAEPPLLWAPGLPYGRGSASRLSCYRDAGGKFEPVEIKAPKGPWGRGPRDMLVDRTRGDVYVKTSGEQWHQFSDADGKYVRLVKFSKNAGGPYSGAHGANLGVTPSGDYFTHCWGKGRGMMRWNRDLKPLNFDGQDTYRTQWGGMMTFQLNYMTMHGNEIYLIKSKQPMHLEVYDYGLKMKRVAVCNVRRGCCPRLDPQGNIYLTAPLRPIGRDFEEFFDGKLPKVPDYYKNIGEKQYWYTYMAGAIVKFPPEGGAFHWPPNKRRKFSLEGLSAKVAAGPKEKYQFFSGGRYPHKQCELQGAEWVRFGYSPYSETYPAGTPVCMCEGAGFDVDGFGRVWHTNLFRFRVEVADTNNNTVATFGSYGNQDSLGGGKSIPRESESAGGAKHPDVPLAWPTYVAVSDEFAYVNDTVGMRVARVKLGAEAEEVCAVR
jgi:hypothetical protein